MENLENIVNNVAEYKVQTDNSLLKTKYYDIYGERVLDLGNNVISSVINFHNLPDKQKQTISVVTDLPIVTINNTKYYALIYKNINILFKVFVLDKKADKNIITSEEIFGYSYFKEKSFTNQKNSDINTSDNNFDNFIFICNTNNLVDFYQFDIPETGCILVFNNRKNSVEGENKTNLMSISDIAKLCYKKDCCFRISQFLAKSIVTYFLKLKKTKHYSLYNEIFNFVNSNSFAKTQESIQKFKFIASKIINKSNFSEQGKLFLIALYYGYIENKIDNQETVNDFVKLLQYLQVNVAGKNSSKIVSIQEDFTINNYSPNTEDIKSITQGINKFNINNYVTFKKVLLKSNK